MRKLLQYVILQALTSVIYGSTPHLRSAFSNPVASLNLARLPVNHLIIIADSYLNFSDKGLL